MGKIQLNIKNFREGLSRKGWTQTDLADSLGLTRAAVSYWVRHPSKIKMSTIEKAANGLGMDFYELIKRQ